MEVCIAKKGSVLWIELIIYAGNCSWRAGKELARLMREDNFRAWECVFAARENGLIAGFCTLTAKDAIPPDLPYTPFIGFVFVDEKFRGQRLSEQLIRKAVGNAQETGFDKVYLVSGEAGLYEKYGFTKKCYLETIYGETEQLFEFGSH